MVAELGEWEISAVPIGPQSSCAGEGTFDSKSRQPLAVAATLSATPCLTVVTSPRGLLVADVRLIDLVAWLRSPYPSVGFLRLSCSAWAHSSAQAPFRQ